MLRRHGLVGVLVLVLLVVSLAGNAAFAAEKVITVFMDIGGAGTAQTGAMELFNEIYKGQYRVEAVRVAWEGMREQVYTEFVARTGAYDVIAINAQWRDAALPYLENLSPWVTQYGPSMDEFVSSMASFCQVGDKIWGLPIRQGITNLFYVRQDLLEEFGLSVPQTPYEVLEVARKLTIDRDGDGKTDIYGMGLMASGAPMIAEEFVNSLYGRGGRLLGENNEVMPFDSKHGELAVEVLEEWKTMVDEGIFPPGILTWGIWEPLHYMQEGRLAMSGMFSPRAALLEDPEESTVAGKIGYYPYPHISPDEGGVSGSLGGWALSIPNYISKERKEIAYKYISFVASFEAQLEMAMNWANEPVRKDVFYHPDYVEFSTAAPAVLKASETAVVMPELSIVQAPDIQLAISDNARAVLLGEISPREAARNIFKKAEEVMAR